VKYISGEYNPRKPFLSLAKDQNCCESCLDKAMKIAVACGFLENAIFIFGRGSGKMVGGSNYIKVNRTFPGLSHI
jgi:hypothetical protein